MYAAGRPVIDMEKETGVRQGRIYKIFSDLGLSLQRRDKNKALSLVGNNDGGSDIDSRFEKLISKYDEVIIVRDGGWYVITLGGTKGGRMRSIDAAINSAEAAIAEDLR
jgi:hypothetical protein